MRFLTLAVLLGLLAPCIGSAQKPAPTSRPNPGNPPVGGPASGPIETETIKIPERMQAPPKSMANQPGYMEPAQTRALLYKLWQGESRVRDLLTQVQPRNTKMPPAVRASYKSDLDTLHRKLAALEKRRRQFSGRVDSEYLGFETYAGIGSVLLPLDRLAQVVSRYGNSSLSAEFNRAWNEMQTLQQSLNPYLAFLLRNHDRIFLITQSNLYGCQNELNYSMRGANGPVHPMRNILPAFKGRRHPAPKRQKASTDANSKSKR